MCVFFFQQLSLDVDSNTTGEVESPSSIATAIAGLLERFEAAMVTEAEVTDMVKFANHTCSQIAL